MNTMLIKQSRDEAVKKREKRKMMVTKDVPPTAGSLTKYSMSPTARL
jgi:hypothetical protein